MSEHTPITGELRDAMRQWGWVERDGSITFATMPPSIDAEQSLAISGSEFDRLCDTIDAVHAQLKRENESLRRELDRVLGEQEDREGWVRLPVDADGEPIHVGDELVADELVADGCVTFTVDCDSLYSWGWRIVGDGHDADGNSCTAHTYPELCHHVSDTWERIIKDAIGEGMARQRSNDSGEHSERANPMNNDTLVARCKALCERTREGNE